MAVAMLTMMVVVVTVVVPETVTPFIKEEL